MNLIDRMYCLLRFEEVLLEDKLKKILGIKYNLKSESWKSLWMHSNRHERVQRAIQFIINK